MNNKLIITNNIIVLRVIFLIEKNYEKKVEFSSDPDLLYHGKRIFEDCGG